MSSLSVIGMIISRINNNINGDQDYVYMGMVDLLTELQKKDILINKNKELDICNIICQLLLSRSTEIQDLCIKCIITICQKFKNINALSHLLLTLTNYIINYENNSLYIRALDNMLTYNRDNLLPTYKQMIKLLLKLWHDKHVGFIWQILEQICNLYGPNIQEYHETLLLTLGEASQISSSNIRKSMVNCLGSLSKSIEPSIFQLHLQKSLEKLQNSNDRENCLQVIRTFSKSSGDRFTPEFIDELIHVLSFVVSNKEIEDNCQFRESCLLSLESVILNCSVNCYHLKNSIVSILQEALKYNPNADDDYESESDDDFQFDDNNNDDDMNDNNNNNDDDDDEDFVSEDDMLDTISDDEDDSYIVRRAAAKCLQAVINKSIKWFYIDQPLKYVRTNNINSFVPTLSKDAIEVVNILCNICINCCIERTQSVQLLILNAFSNLLQIINTTNCQDICIDPNIMLISLKKAFIIAHKLKIKGLSSLEHIIEIMHEIIIIMSEKIQHDCNVDIVKLLMEILDYYAILDKNNEQAHLPTNRDTDNVRLKAFQCLKSCVELFKHSDIVIYILPLMKCSLNSINTLPNSTLVPLNALHLLNYVLKLILRYEDHEHLLLPMSYTTRIDIISGADESWLTLSLAFNNNDNNIDDYSETNNNSNCIMNINEIFSTNIFEICLKQVQDIDRDSSIRSISASCLGYASKYIKNETQFVLILQSITPLLASSSTRIAAVRSLNNSYRWYLHKNINQLNLPSKVIIQSCIQHLSIICTYVRQSNQHLVLISLSCVYYILKILQNCKKIHEQITVSLSNMFKEYLNQQAQNDQSIELRELWLSIINAWYPLASQNENNIELIINILHLEFEGKNFSSCSIRNNIINIFNNMSNKSRQPIWLESYDNKFAAQCIIALHTKANQQQLYANALANPQSTLSLWIITLLSNHFNNANAFESLIKHKTMNDIISNIYILECISVVGSLNNEYAIKLYNMIFDNNSIFSMNEIIVILLHLVNEFDVYMMWSIDVRNYWNNNSLQIIKYLLFACNQYKKQNINELLIIDAICNWLCFYPVDINILDLNHIQRKIILKSYKFYISKCMNIYNNAKQLQYNGDRTLLWKWMILQKQHIINFQKMLHQLLIDNNSTIDIIESVLDIILTILITQSSVNLELFVSTILFNLACLLCDLVKPNNKYIEEIKLGPITKCVDKAIEMRKLSWRVIDALFILLKNNDTWIQKLKNSLLYGLNDINEIRLIVHTFLGRISMYRLINNIDEISQYKSILRDTLNIQLEEDSNIGLNIENLDELKTSANNCNNIIEYFYS